LFKELVQQPDAEHLKNELKWLTEQLGAARDLAVLLKEGVKRLQQEDRFRVLPPPVLPGQNAHSSTSCR
jgi:hypothetical protein